ncbi:MAG: DUF5721 family protein [Defluviitaleaceae bacterium]|nr:DUF5721 family protein [Defluviitaleaceae bacterium]
MLMLSPEQSNIRTIMNALLTTEVFDNFELRACIVQSFARFDIEGALPNLGEEKSQTSYNTWQRLRPYVHNIIKGNARPGFMKVILSYPVTNISALQDASALFLNIILDKDSLHITTGISLKEWTPNKSTEEAWDEFITKFLRENNLIEA